MYLLFSFLSRLLSLSFLGSPVGDAVQKPPSEKIAPTTIYVCPTTHLDWDWLNSFEQYYANGFQPSVNPVKFTFDQMISLLNAPSSTFCFSLAELGYLQRYFIDNPSAGAALLSAGNRLCLMGGGITSPDSLTCHGETFIRNYLVGTQWLKQIGLDSLRSPLAWLPDDFGHDPQLPVVLQAMGMSAVGLSRVPGSIQGTPCAVPIAGGASVASQLENTNGLVFLWGAKDGSQTICHFMPDTYAVSSANLQGFVSTYSGDQWNGVNMFVPVPSHDFATPTTQIQEDITNYNTAPVNGVKAQIATFQDFISAVQTNLGALGSPFTLYASNYWTGYFASRPALKINHNLAARELMAAETASAILQIYSTLAASAGDSLNAAIHQGWRTLLPSTHHDFITGTSPDWIYGSEQLPLSQQALDLSVNSRSKATELLAGAVQGAPKNNETPVVVLNSLGFQRSGVVELYPNSVTATTASVRGPSGACTMQPLSNGGMLFQATGIASLGWNTFYLASGTPPKNPKAPVIGSSVVLENNLLSVTLSEEDSWFITSFYDKQASLELIRDSMVGNEIRIYSDSGNLYQFGNEPLYCSPTQYGTFKEVNTAFQTVGTPSFIEYGPLQQTFAVTIQDSISGQSYSLEYTLMEDEPFLRMKTTGAAPPSSSVVVAFPLISENNLVPDGLMHGTPYHWDDQEPTRYWNGPTFQATHDFVLPTESTSNPPYVAAIYHGDVPAWCRNQGTSPSDSDIGTILGTILRNADGLQRGAAGTDGATHTREYALRIPSGLSAPSTGIPLQESLALTTPLFAEIQYSLLSLPSYLQQSGSLASVTPSQAIIRAVRGQDGSGPLVSTGVPTSFVLRIYNPDSAVTSTQVTLPFQSSSQPIVADLVTALEDPIPNSQITPNGQNITVPTPHAITTVQIQTNRVFSVPNNGK